MRNDLSNLSSIIAQAQKSTPAQTAPVAPETAGTALAAEGERLNSKGVITPHDGKR